MSKAEKVFTKIAGPVSYVKGLVKATRELPHNLEAVKIYSKEIGNEQKVINDINRKRFFNFGSDEAIDSAMNKLKRDAEDEIINNVKNQISHLRYSRKPHLKEIRKGLVLPGTAVLATGVGGKAYQTSLENKPKNT